MNSNSIRDETIHLWVAKMTDPATNFRRILCNPLVILVGWGVSPQVGDG